MVEIRSRKGSAVSAISKVSQAKFHEKKAASYSNWMAIMEKYSFIFFLILIAVYTAL